MPNTRSAWLAAGCLVASALAQTSPVLAAPNAAKDPAMPEQHSSPDSQPAARTAIEAVIAAHLDALEKGDIAAMSAQWASRGTVIDGFAPFIWSGDNAIGTWWNAAKALLAPAGINRIHTAIHGWKRFNIQGNRAFAVADATATLSGPAMTLRADGMNSFILDSSGGNWRIVSWAWVGGEPTPLPGGGANH